MFISGRNIGAEDFNQIFESNVWNRILWIEDLSRSLCGELQSCYFDLYVGCYQTISGSTAIGTPPTGHFD